MSDDYPAGVFHDAGCEPEKGERCIFDVAETPTGKVLAVRVYMGGSDSPCYKEAAARGFAAASISRNS